MARIPPALAAKSAYRSSGLIQTTRRLDLASRSISAASLSGFSRSSPSVNRSTIAPCPSTRRDQSRLNRASASPIRVPPDQSKAIAEHRASASSGSRARMALVTLVRRVPKRNVETRRVSPKACRKCRTRRVYSFIDPEMSHKATTGGARSIGERNSRSITPPGCNERRKLRRASIRIRRPPGANRRVRRLSSGIMSRLIALRASSISAALIWAKSFDRKISASDIVSLASSSIEGTDLAASCADLNRASATRLAPASAGFGSGRLGARGDSMAMSFSISPFRFQKIRNA